MDVTRCVAVLACILCWTLAGAGEPAVRYHKAGGEGVFQIELPIPPEVDPLAARFSARSEDEKLHLVYLRSPQSVASRLARRARGDEGPELTPEEKARKATLDTRIAELQKGRRANWPAIAKNREQIRGLEALVKELGKGQEGDKAMLQRAKASLAELKADSERREKENQDYAKKLQPLYAERNKLVRAAWERRPNKPPASSLRVLGRFQGVGRTKLDIFVRDSGQLLEEPRRMTSLELDLPKGEHANPDLLKEWARTQAEDFALRVVDSPHSSYYQYCLLQSMARYGLPRSILPRHLQRAPRRDRRVDLYAMTTGALAIQESLQLDAMTGRLRIPDDRSVELGSLTGPDIRSHPFEEMLEGRTPRIFPAAAFVPYDNYYCHFTSISKEIAVSDLLKNWGTSLLRVLTVTARDSDVPSKYQQQLCIGVSVLTRLFGDLVIGEIALTGTDPFLREGTDLTVIIQVKDREIFDKQMDTYIQDALRKNPDAKATRSKYQGAGISSVSTPDRRISSHSAYLGNYKVYSNSPDALRLVIDTHAKRRRALADEPCFRYMRSIFPGEPTSEDGFIYLSDPFIRRLLSPRWKIEAQRRIICQNHLRMIGNASTMYRTEMREEGPVEALVADRYLDSKALKCPDGGSYSLDGAGRARCSTHNCLRYCTPILSIRFDKVASGEADDYKRFVQRYNRYWSRFFDPIGIRFKVGNQIEVETCILPLIENTIYNQLRALVGGSPVPLKARTLTDQTIVSVAAKLGLDQPDYRELLREMQRALPPGTVPVTVWAGDSLSLGLCDGDVLFTVDERGLSMFGGWMDLEEQLVLGTILSSINLPMYAVLELKDSHSAEVTIRELLKLGQRESDAQARTGRAEFGLDSYAAEEHNGHAIGTVVLRLFVIKFRLHYSIASSRLVVATKRPVLENVLDALDKEGADGSPEANVSVSIRPPAFKRLRPVTTVGWQERMRDACLKNLVPIRSLTECHGATEQDLGELSRRIEGCTMRCPSGGRYVCDGARDLLYCTVHGDRDHPRQPLAPTGREALLHFVKRMQDLSVALRFTEEGIMTKVQLLLSENAD